MPGRTKTRDRILDAAAAVMRTHGLAGATTREIARAAGLTEAALYRHFRSKEELLGHMLAERLPPFIGVLKELPGRVGQGTVPGTLEELASAATLFYEQLVPMLAPVFSEPALLARQQEAMRQTGLGPHRANEALAAYLRAEQNLGRVPPDASPEATATLLLGACFQRGFFRRFFGEDVLLPTADRFASELVRTLARGLSA